MKFKLSYHYRWFNTYSSFPFLSFLKEVYSTMLSQLWINVWDCNLSNALYGSTMGRKSWCSCWGATLRSVKYLLWACSASVPLYSLCWKDSKVLTGNESSNFWWIFSIVQMIDPKMSSPRPVSWTAWRRPLIFLTWDSCLFGIGMSVEINLYSYLVTCINSLSGGNSVMHKMPWIRKITSCLLLDISSNLQRWYVSGFVYGTISSLSIYRPSSVDYSVF